MVADPVVELIVKFDTDELEGMVRRAADKYMSAVPKHIRMPWLVHNRIYNFTSRELASILNL